MAEQKLGTKVATGVAWSFSEKLLTMIIQMVVSIIVARQLSPDDFGVMAIMTFFTSVALTIVDSGFSQTLIRKSKTSNEEYSSVFAFNVVVSLLLYVVLVALAKHLAAFYGDMVIADIAPVLFLVLPINALCVVQTVMFTREFRFALLSKIVFVASLISGVVAVAMALAGYGVWSLVVQRLLQMGIKAAAFWIIRRWRVSWRIGISPLREMAPFSLRLLATDLIASIYNNVAQLFIGKMHNTSMLGYYSQAQKLKDLPVTSTVQAVQGVTYPALSTMADDREKLTVGYGRIVNLVSYLLFPVMLGLVAVAPEMFALLLGDKWMPTVPYFEILALAGVVYPLSVVSYNILKVKSDGRLILRLEILKRLLMTVMLCYTIPRGVESIAWGMSAMAAVDFIINTLFALRYVDMGVGAFLRVVAPQLLLASAMFVLLYAINPYCESMSVGIHLLIDIVVGGAFYLSLSYILRLSAFDEGLKLLRSMRSKSE